MQNRFKVGETVIALTNPEDGMCQPREAGKAYKVAAVQFCTQCGLQMINLGHSTPQEIVGCLCGSSELTRGNKWTSAHHFCRPADLQQYLEEAVEKEDYETAVVIRDTMALVTTDFNNVPA